MAQPVLPGDLSSRLTTTSTAIIRLLSVNLGPHQDRNPPRTATWQVLEAFHTIPHRSSSEPKHGTGRAFLGLATNVDIPQCPTFLSIRTGGFVGLPAFPEKS